MQKVLVAFGKWKQENQEFKASLSYKDPDSRKVALTHVYC